MSFIDSRTLITGSTGYIGSHVAQGFTNSGLTYDILNSRYPSQTWLDLDVKGYYSIIHAAGLAHGKQESIGHSYNVNYKFPIELAKKAKRDGVKKFIFISSSSLYCQIKEKRLNENDPIEAKNFLLKHKLDTENELLEMSTSDFNVIILRLPLVYSLDAPANFAKLKKISLFSRFQPFGLANYKKSYLSVDNLVDALITVVLSRGNKCGVYNLTDNNDMSLKEFVSLIRNAYILNTCHIPVPIFIFYFLLKSFNRMTIFSLAFIEDTISCKKFMSDFDWRPLVTPEETLNIKRDTR